MKEEELIKEIKRQLLRYASLRSRIKTEYLQCKFTAIERNEKLFTLTKEVSEIIANTSQVKDEEIKEIFKVYDKYVKVLEDENSSLVGLAYIHGWRSSRIELGKKCRAKIKALKARYCEKGGE